MNVLTPIHMNNNDSERDRDRFAINSTHSSNRVRLRGC
jgi:hypothetical protein